MMDFDCVDRDYYKNFFHYIISRNTTIKGFKHMWIYLISMGLIIPQFITDQSPIKNSQGDPLNFNFIDLTSLLFLLVTLIIISTQFVQWITLYEITEETITKKIKYLPFFDRREFRIDSIKYILSSEKFDNYLLKFGDWPWQVLVYQNRKTNTDKDLVARLLKLKSSLEVHKI